MSKHVQYKEMLREVGDALAELPEHRRGENWQYELRDAGLSAFSVFYMQAPSFLAWQEDMEKKKGKNNARSLFGIRKTPGVEQIKNLLDPVREEGLGRPFWWVYHELAGRGQLQGYQGVAGTYLISLDGTRHHASPVIHCPQCRVTVRKEKASYEHQVLLAVVCAPEREQVICLEPEFITPQDGHDKQDCEQAAIKRWVQRHGPGPTGEFAPWRVTVLADDLHSHQPMCELLMAQQMYFIFTCKPASHPTLYEELSLLAGVEGAIQQQTVRFWNGRHYERRVYRWVEALPLRRGEDALLVTWCAWTVYDERTGAQTYHNAWITNHTVTTQTVVAVAAAGRARWKVENEGINVLKQHGYCFEHNYGHGQQHLANVLLCCLLLAFLVHTVLDLGCAQYQAVRQALRTRRKFFESLRTLTRFYYYDNWDHLLTFMFHSLELDTG